MWPVAVLSSAPLSMVSVPASVTVPELVIEPRPAVWVIVVEVSVSSAVAPLSTVMMPVLLTVSVASVSSAPALTSRWPALVKTLTPGVLVLDLVLSRR